MSGTFFKNFPLLAYQFGNEVTPVLFQNISAYVSLIDEIKDEATAYTTITINDGERPDTLSYKLYGDETFYWTFFFLNNDIRESGWPLTENEVYEYASKFYPNWTVTTQAPIHNIFLEGQNIEGLSSDATGTVVKRFLDMGQIIVNKNDPNGVRDFRANEIIRSNNNFADIVETSGAVLQYNSVHHYENTDGEWVDIDPFNPNTSGLIPVTYLERLRNLNDKLREIKVFTPETVVQVQSEFSKLMLKG